MYLPLMVVDELRIRLRDFIVCNTSKVAYINIIYIMKYTNSLFGIATGEPDMTFCAYALTVNLKNKREKIRYS